MHNPLMSYDRRFLDLLDAFGVDARNRPIKTVTINLTVSEVATIVIVEYADANRVELATEVVKRYELQAVEVTEPIPDEDGFATTIDRAG